MRRYERGHKCPRCGKVGSRPHPKWVLNEQKVRYEPYYYVAHSKIVAGRKTIKWCYLGKSKTYRKGKKRRKVSKVAR